MTPEELKKDYREYERERDRIMSETNMDTGQLKMAWRKIPIGVKLRRVVLDDEGFFRL